jgi:hypothetical protein
LPKTQDLARPRSDLMPPVASSSDFMQRAGVLAEDPKQVSDVVTNPLGALRRACLIVILHCIPLAGQSSVRPYIPADPASRL